MPRPNFFNFRHFSSGGPAQYLSRGAWHKALLLHAAVLVLMVALPYFQRAPKIPEPKVVQAILVAHRAAPQAHAATPPTPARPTQEAAPPITPPPEKSLAKPLEKITPKIPEAVFHKETIKKPLEKPLTNPTKKPTEKVADKKKAPPAAAQHSASEKPTPAKPTLKKPQMSVNDFEKEMQEIRAQEQQQALQRDAAKSAAAAQASTNSAIRDKYMQLINQQLASKWNRPLSARNGMQATLHITVLPGGEVGSVLVIKGSGNAAFDASAAEAVRRASPLPVPADAAVFNTNFRAFNLKFNPEDL